MGSPWGSRGQEGNEQLHVVKHWIETIGPKVIVNPRQVNPRRGLIFFPWFWSSIFLCPVNLLSKERR